MTRRRRLALVAVPVALALLAAVKLGSLAPLTAAGTSDFEHRRAAPLARVATWLGRANLIQPERAEFARGDAAVLAGDFAAARRHFAAALDGAAPADECRIRVNLALSIERLGDLRAALTVVDDAPAHCFAPGDAGNRDGEGGRLTAARKRIAAELEKSRSGGEPDGSSDDEASSAKSPDQRLEEQSRRAQQKQVEAERGEHSLDSVESPPADHPW